MDRREFLKTLALTGAAVTMKWDGVMDIMAQNTSQAGGCDLVAKCPTTSRGIFST
jgi:hypothetical protein